MNKKLIVALIILALIAHRVILKHIISGYAKKLEENSSGYFYNNPNWSEVRQKTIENWRNSGNALKPRKTALKSLEGFDENEEFNEAEYIEKDEFHKNLNEAFKGMTDSEISEILDTVLDKDCTDYEYHFEES